MKIALAQGNLDEAEEMLDTVLSVNNQSHWALAEQGWLAFQKGMLDKALHLLEQAVEICGDNSTYRRRLVCIKVFACLLVVRRIMSVVLEVQPSSTMQTFML